MGHESGAGAQATGLADAGPSGCDPASGELGDDGDSGDGEGGDRDAGDESGVDLQAEEHEEHRGEQVA